MENRISLEQEKEKTKNNNIKRKYNIEPNKYNKMPDYDVDKESFCSLLLDNFIEYCLYYPEKAYELLDEEYRNTRFKNFDNFKEYLEDAIDTIEKSSVSQYIINKYDNYEEYVLIDFNENYYTFKCYGGYNYEVLLDNYTLPTQTYLSSYSRGNAEERVKSNIKKFIEMINSKDYINAYDKLAESFKKNKFQDKDIFKKFVKENMYEYSEIEFEEFKAEGNLYIYNIKLTERNAPAHPAKNMQVIMELEEGLDFKMSFNIK